MNWEKIKLYATTFTAMAAATGLLYSAGIAVDTRYAKTVPTNHRLGTLERKQTLKELKELLDKALDRLYFYEEQLKKYPNNEKIKKLYRKAKRRVDYLERRIEKLEEEQRRANETSG